MRLIDRFCHILWSFVRGKSDSAAVGMNLAIRIAILAINFGTGVIVARSLGPGGRGQLTAITLWPPLIATLATLGMPTALNFRSRRQPADASRLYMVSAVMMLMGGLVASAVGAAAMPFLLHGYDAGTVRFAQLMMLFAPETLVAAAARAHLESRGQFRRSTLGLFYPTVATLVALCALRFANDLTPATAALSYIVPPAVQAVWVVWRLWQPSAFRYRCFAEDIRLLLGYGLKCYGLDLIGALSGQADLVIIVAFLSPARLGLYSVALSLSGVLFVIYASLKTVLFPRASSLAIDDAIELVTRSARLCTLFCLLCGLGWLFVLRIAVPIVYGRAFVDAIPLLALLIAAVVVDGHADVLSQSFMAAGRPAVVTVAQVVWTGAAISFLLLLVPRMNIAGAATSLLLAGLVRLGLVMAAYPALLRRPVPQLLLNASDVAYVRDKIEHVWFGGRALAAETGGRAG